MWKQVSIIRKHAEFMWQNCFAYRAKYNKRGICTLEGSKEQAGPSPEKRMKYHGLPSL
jgi:hypothetical protein